MASELIISVSGLRGIVGETLTPEVARRYAAAFAKQLPPGRVVITRDGRANGGELVSPIAQGLSQSSSRKVFNAGIAATPTTGILVRELHCVGGVQISASHNPAEYNGLKLFSSEGRVIPASKGEQVLQEYNSLLLGGDEPSIASERELVIPDDTVAKHLSLLEHIVDVERIRARRFRVLLDANHGSGSILGSQLLERLGCTTVVLGEKPDGRFAHAPEPTAENLQTVLAEILRTRADVGFCQDPDADRLAIIDEQGRYLGEEYTLALCVNHVLGYKHGPVVTNCSTSRMTEDIARRFDVPFHRSAVGEANVVDVMLREHAVIGGEGNGGVIDPRVGLVRDSFVGMALVLDAMAARNVPVSHLAGEMPQYTIHKSKSAVRREAMPAAFLALEQRFSDAAVDRLDGLRFDWQEGDTARSWLLIRASNTEPIVRIIAESPHAAVAEQLCRETERVLAELS